jgi:hypothetical protein
VHRGLGTANVEGGCMLLLLLERDSWAVEGEGESSSSARMAAAVKSHSYTSL